MLISANRDSIHQTNHIQKSQGTAYPKQIGTTEEAPSPPIRPKKKYPLATPLKRKQQFIDNRSDFLELYNNAPLHAGLIIIVPNVTPAR
jgi:hypothetical protein